MNNKTLSRRNFCKAGTTFALLSTFPLSAFAKTISRFSLTGKSGMALKGYDTTAYFKAGKPTKGNDATIVQWKGATWRFAEAKDAALFKADPTAYAPQFGGYCTRAMSLKKEVPGDPEVWRIHNGNLYVFFAARGGVFFDKGPDSMIKKAQVHWDTLTFVE